MENITPAVTPKVTKADSKKRKEDAQDLALLLYDIYKESNLSGNVNNGQNYANQNDKAD
jgi:hypothetical protein